MSRCSRNGVGDRLFRALAVRSDYPYQDRGDVPDQREVKVHHGTGIKKNGAIRRQAVRRMEHRFHVVALNARRAMTFQSAFSPA